MSRQYTHQADRGRVRVVGKRMPRELRGCDEWTEATLRIGPVSRLAGAVLGRIGGRR